MDKNRLKEPVYRFLINPGFNKIHIDSTFVVRFNLAAVAAVEFIFDEMINGAGNIHFAGRNPGGCQSLIIFRFSPYF